MTAFLTGGTGFIGAHIARALVARGERVRCLVRPNSRLDNLEGLALETVQGDLTDISSLRRALAGCEVVFHCAADYRLYALDPGELYRNNVDGTRNLLQAAAEAHVARVVYTSTVGTLRPNEDGVPATEEAQGTLEQMTGDYKRSKLLAEREVAAWLDRGLPIVTVNPATVVGELDIRPTPTGEIIVDFLNGRMPAYVDTGLNLIDVRDVAAGHLLAAERGEPGRSYLLANQNFTFKELLALLALLTGLPAPRVRLPGWLPVAIAHVEAHLGVWRSGPPRVSLEAAQMARHRMFFDGGRAVRELGLPQSPIAPALARSISWFVEHGYARRPRSLRLSSGAVGGIG
jgi:dihydroflavonol-4-reductase